MNSLRNGEKVVESKYSQLRRKSSKLICIFAFSSYQCHARSKPNNTASTQFTGDCIQAIRTVGHHRVYFSQQEVKNAYSINGEGL